MSIPKIIFDNYTTETTTSIVSNIESVLCNLESQLDRIISIENKLDKLESQLDRIISIENKLDKLESQLDRIISIENKLDKTNEKLEKLEEVININKNIDIKIDKLIGSTKSLIAYFNTLDMRELNYNIRSYSVKHTLPTNFVPERSKLDENI
jgi:vacuolar-type H+-ATPase subunit I/STV1